MVGISALMNKPPNSEDLKITPKLDKSNGMNNSKSHINGINIKNEIQQNTTEHSQPPIESRTPQLAKHFKQGSSTGSARNSPLSSPLQLSTRFLPNPINDPNILSSSKSTKIAFTVRDLNTGRMIICLLEPTQTILDLKEKISAQEGFPIQKIYLSMAKKDTQDKQLLSNYVDLMKHEWFELHRNSDSLQTLLLKKSEIRGLDGKEKKCMTCNEKASDHCSTCGKPVCNTCGHWSANLQSNFIVSSSRISLDEEQILGDGNVINDNSVRLMPKPSPMYFFTQCPECRTEMAKKHLTEHGGNLLSQHDAQMRERKRIIIFIVATLLLCLLLLVSIQVYG